MASTPEPRPRSSDDDVHAVGVFRPTTNDDGSATPAPDRQPGLEHLGRDAARRAVVLALVFAVVGAAVLALVVAGLTDVRGPALVATIIGGAAFIGAIGGLWGAFSKLGKGDDWREAMTGDRRTVVVDDAGVGGSQASDDDVDELESHGATEVHVVDEDPSANPANRVDRP